MTSFRRTKEDGTVMRLHLQAPTALGYGRAQFFIDGNKVIDLRVDTAAQHVDLIESAITDGFVPDPPVDETMACPVCAGRVGAAECPLCQGTGWVRRGAAEASHV